MADAFCTTCGAPRAPGANFCTACGASLTGAAPARPAAAGKPAAVSTATIAAGAALLLFGAAAAYVALREETDVPRAVAGSPSASAKAGSQPAAPGSELPSGHPSIELPKEVVDFLEGLSAEAAKDPQNVEAAQKLARARYRASVINASYRVSAQQALDKLLALEPGNVEGLRISANLAYDAGSFVEAEKRFGAYLAKSPDDASALTDLGSAQLFQERVDDALVSYRKALEKDPKFMQAHFNLGIALQRKGNKAESIESLKKALDFATTPDERQHIENALAELEGREPQKIAGTRSDSATPPAGGVPGTSGAPGAHAGSAAAAAQATPGAAGSGSGATGMPGGMPMPPPAPDREVPTNASNAFQRAAEKPLITHPIVGPRIVAFEWTGPASARAKIADFPMDRMPPFALAKFKQGMAAKLSAVGAANGVTGAIRVELVDNAGGNVMDTLDSVADAQPAAAAPGAAAPAPAAPSK